MIPTKPVTTVYAMFLIITVLVAALILIPACSLYDSYKGKRDYTVRSQVADIRDICRDIWVTRSTK